MKNKIIFSLLLILSNFILNASTGVLEKELRYNYRAYYNFETNQVLNVEDLVTRYLDDQYQYLWVAPPDPSVSLYQKGRSIALLNYKGFDYSFLTGLIAEEKDGVRTYPVWIYENSDDSKVVIANKDGKELISFDREINYSPDWFVFNELFGSVNRTKEQQDWLLACYDPSRIVMRYDLIVGEDDLMAYVWEQSQPDLQELFSVSIPMAMRSSSVVSNLRFSVVEQLTNGVQLTVEWGEATLSDDELDFFVCNDIITKNWFIEDTEEVDLSTNVYTWVDYNATNDTSRFYTCWTLYDTDGDGISDGRETLLYGTSITNSDTDGDGTYDIVELYYGFDPKDPITPEDWDNDGLLNNFEYYYTNSVSTNGIERLNAKLFDSDGDKLPDLFEVMYTNFNPCISNSFEGESLFGDPDEDELNNAEEMQYGTNPWLFDTDGDGTNDYDEVHTNHTDPLDSSNDYAETVVNCIMELSAVDDNDYMLMIMGSSSTNIFLTSYTNNILFTNKICSIGQPLNVELSRNLEVESDYSPELTDSDVAFRVYTMDPWVITCYGWYYPYVRNSQLEELSSSPSPLTITTTSSPMTMETTAGGGAVDVSFYTPTMTVDIINEYDPYYCYIMCGCGSLPNPLNVTAQVTIDWMVGLSGTLYVFNPEPITCTAAAVANSVFNSDSDADTIIITDTITEWTLYNNTKEAHFTLATDDKNTLSSSECNQYYSFDVNVDVTSTNMESCSDDTGIPVYVFYSHGTWTIDSMLNPSNVINILNSPTASVYIDFHHSVCANYGLNGTLDITPDGNTDIFTLDDISREINIEESPYSTSEGFDVIGCSDDLGDMIVDLEFDGDEYHSASYSLTSCALAVSNLTDSISMYDGLGDADNDGTNNVSDLNNAGEFIEILIKTHESATNAYFRLDFDEDNIKLWTEDSNAMITRTNSYIPNGNLIQAYHNYSYNDLFADEAERTFYVQGLEVGEHDIDVVYVLDGVDLWTNDLSVTFCEVTSVDEYVPTMYVPFTVKRIENGTNYFATAKGVSPILQATIEPAVNDSIARNLSWEASGTTINYPNQPDKTSATISSQTAQQVTLRIKYNNETCWEGIVWFCWGEMQAKIAETDTLSLGNDCAILTYTNGLSYWPEMLGGGNYLGTIDLEANTSFFYGPYAAGKIESTATIEPAEVVNIFPEVWQIRQDIIGMIGWENAGNYFTIYNTWTSGPEQLWPPEGGFPNQVKPDGPEGDAVDNDPTSGVSTNKLYALDIPGTPYPQDHHTYERYRNFRTYLTFCTDDTSEYGLITCSDQLNWSQRTRIDADKVGSKIDLNELNLYHIAIPTTPYYQYRQ